MKEPERISFLVDTLEGGNATRFSEKTGIRTQSISCLRHGKYKIGRYVQRISDAYPDVSVKWLKTGEGEPFLSTPEKGVVLSKIESLEKEVRRLTKIVEQLAKVSTSYQL